MQDANAAGTIADTIVAGLPAFGPPIATGAGDAPVPLPTIPDHDRLPDAVYALARIDASGRIADHTTPTALDWHPGDQLVAEAVDSTTIVVHREAGGPTTVTAKRHVVIPTPSRHRCGIHPGDQVFLAALPHTNVLHIHPLTYLDTLYTQHRAEP
jgi:hypothetical protein